jgi:glycosyltransferase involved in cell wall biosynthesis
MTESISVVISTFGDPVYWGAVAQRAIRSALSQTIEADGVYYNHADTPHEARNRGAEQANSKWLVFLDADDELDPFYLEAMTRYALDCSGPALIQPATLGVVGDREDPHPVLIPRKPLLDGNFMVIGTMVQREQFLRVGGFEDWPIYEDWDLWIRCWLDGAELVAGPNAIYRVHVSEGSRNNQDRKLQVAVYNQIRSKHQRQARRARR